MIHAYLYAAILAAVVGVLAWGGHGLYRAGAAEVRAEWAAADARLAEEQRLLARERGVAIARIDRESVSTAARRAAAVRGADAAGSGLRVRSTALVTAAAAASPAGQCEAALAAARVHSDLLGRVEEAGRRMAATATERGDAGSACERVYDALTSAAEPTTTKSATP